jgi:3-hydroxybutyryl-CoA dehydrogenase
VTLPNSVGVIGGGRMGAGIAHAFLVAGCRVILVESTPSQAADAEDRVATSLQRASDRGTLTVPLGTVRQRLHTTHLSRDLAAATLIVEAVPEAIELKQRVLATAQRYAPGAYLATNTSSLSVDVIAAELTNPEQLIGLHFFNPVPASDLVEIVVGPRPSPELVPLATTWVADLGKTGITVTDSPGFASSRLGVAIALEAMRMLESGVASAADIDTAMTLGYKHPTGPLRTTDLVGLDVRLAIAEHLEQELGPRFAAPQVLRDLVESGHLGRKTGQGFYTW